MAACGLDLVYGVLFVFFACFCWDGNPAVD